MIPCLYKYVYIHSICNVLSSFLLIPRLVSVVVNLMGDVFPELKQQETHIRNVIEEEEESFGRTLIKVTIGICSCIFMGFH